MRVVFMGTADFALPALERLAQSRHAVVAVYTQPPRPGGRGHQARRTAVHDAADALNLEVRTPRTLKDAAVQEELRALEADVGVVAAYGLLLPQAVLDAPRLGCLNLHGSLLPRWRGAAPVERAIEAGDSETGVMIFQMEKGLDTGPIFAQARAPIETDTTGPDLRGRLAWLAADLLLPLLDELEAGRAVATPQPEAGVTYAAKIDKSEYALDVTAPAAVLERRVRAFSPHAWLPLGGERLRVLAAEVVDAEGAPGEVLDDRLTIACGEGALRPKQVQPAGRRVMATADFLRGRAVPAGTQLG
ncbi:MAG: methionyl-tRNA formyltransferase [Alphaproteobacteria bacterium]